MLVDTNIMGQLLNYIYNNYAIAFIMCLLGSFIKDAIDGLNNSNTLNIKKIFVSTIFSSFLAGAASDWIKLKISFGGYLFICLIIGMWGFWILKCASNSSIMYIFFKKLFKNLSGPLAKSISDAANEIDNVEKKNKDETTHNKEDNNIN